jgi:N-acetylmuramoyl-L-alanine amidase
VSAKTPDKSGINVIVIDAGHGGKDRGTTGGTNPEKKITLQIALKLGEKIKESMPNVKVIYTRKKDIFIPLHERASIANKNKADLFISIHCNANPHSGKIYGTETYTMGLHKTEENLDVAQRENGVMKLESDYKKKYKGFDPNSPLAYIMLANYQKAFLANSLNLANKIENQFKKNTRKSRGVKQAGFWVLWDTTMPSVLVETGYLTNETENIYLDSAEGQEKVANSILKAIKAYKKEVEN